MLFVEAVRLLEGWRGFPLPLAHPLVHWTSWESAHSILRSGALETQHSKSQTRDSPGASHSLAFVPSVSLTRQLQMTQGLGDWRRPFGFVFDRQDLTQALGRPQPYSDTAGRGLKARGAGEAEERVPKNIPLSLARAVLVSDQGLNNDDTWVAGQIADYLNVPIFLAHVVGYDPWTNEETGEVATPGDIRVVAQLTPEQLPGLDPSVAEEYV